MTDIAQRLKEQADQVRPDPNLGDVLQRVRHRRRRSIVRRSVGFLVVAAAVIGLAAIQHADRSPSVATPTAPLTSPATPRKSPVAAQVTLPQLVGVPSTLPASSPGSPVTTALASPTSPLAPSGAIVAAAIDAPTSHASEAGGNPGLQRHDSSAASGPFSTVVRRSDGRFGLHSAVITAPIAAPKGGEPVAVGHTAGVSFLREIDWQIGSTWVRIRSDLTPDEMVAIATNTTLSADGGNRPIVDAPAGFAVSSTGQYISTDVNEFRYGSVDVGEGGALGNGLTYTGVYAGAGFEDRLLGLSVVQFVDVAGHAAVASAIQGGSATLAWESAPGIVVYVGYSGDVLDDGAIAGLARLAARLRLIDGAQWRSLDPQVDEQSNLP